MVSPDSKGPLTGIRVIELGGLGPGPFATMTLADLGADVVRIDRPGAVSVFPGEPGQDLLNRGKRSVALDLKRPEAVDAVLTSLAGADILVEGSRPGVAERLGLGPQDCWARNPRLVYGRMTGWGQTGPLARTAGHDVNYIALTGALHALGDADGPPQIPLNLLGDFGGGAMYLVAGLLAALRVSEHTGKGQVVDAAIVDGVAHLLTGTHALSNASAWADERGVNLLDGGAPFYAVYETADGRHMTVGAIEEPFYAVLLDVLGIRDAVPPRSDRDAWPDIRETIAATFRTRTMAEWTEAFAGTDACVAPVLSLSEAAHHPHIMARGCLTGQFGECQPAPAPRFSVSRTGIPRHPPMPGQDTRAVLEQWGVDGIDELFESGCAVECAQPT